MKFRTSCVLTACLSLGVASAHAQSVKIEFQDGRVTIAAQNATPRQILAEWAKVGGTRIVNADRVPGTPMTIELNAVAERQALDVVLRNASGYMASARRTGPGTSMLDRVHILPTSTAAPARQGGPGPAVPATRAAVPAFQPPVVEDTFDDVEVEEPQGGRGVGVPIQRGGIGQPVRGIGVPNQGQLPGGLPQSDDEPVEEPQAPQPTPGNPFGVAPGSARPGVITPPPARPGTPGQPAQPGQPGQPGR
jgi:hypothetical protein